MTSIVITPFDSEHAEELSSFIKNELDNADFEGEEMPSSVHIEDVAALKRQRDLLLDFVVALLHEWQHRGKADQYDKAQRTA